MLKDKPDYAGQKRRQRGHAAGDHSMCNYQKCLDRQQLELQNDFHLYAIAVFDECKRQGVYPKTFLGDRLAEYRAMAAKEFPDYDYLPTEPDFVHRIQAHMDVAEKLFSGPRY